MFNQLYDISETMEESSFCGLGQSVPIPLRSILDRFKDEFLSHLNSPGCPVGVCEFDKPEKKKR
jgi:NADH-quinone oxidoreductase subunit F